MKARMYWFWVIGLIVFIAAAWSLLYRTPVAPPRHSSDSAPGLLEAHWSPPRGRTVGIDMPFTVTLPLPARTPNVEAALTVLPHVPYTVTRGLGLNQFLIRPRQGFWPANTHLRLGLAETLLWPTVPHLAPVSRDTVTTDDGRTIVVNLSYQTMQVYQGNHLIRTMPVSTGVPPAYTTPDGTFYIWRRVKTGQMQGGKPGTAAFYSVPHVPYAQYIFGGIAIHGAYWNPKLGKPLSHGCIQLATQKYNKHPQGIPENAGWLWHFAHLGTPVIVVGKTPALRRAPLAYPKTQWSRQHLIEPGPVP